MPIRRKRASVFWMELLARSDPRSIGEPEITGIVVGAADLPKQQALF